MAARGGGAGLLDGERWGSDAPDRVGAFHHGMAANGRRPAPALGGRLARCVRQIPANSQYEHVNKGMSLDAFKTIFWWEWVHRFLGRLVAAALLLPFLY